MIIGTGIDIVSVSKIEETLERHRERFIRRIFTDSEASYCEQRLRRFEHYAARFAAKEALLKALGTGANDQAHFRDVEVRNDEHGRPSITLTGSTAEYARQIGVEHIHISLSHADDVAVAQVVLEG